MKILLGVSGSIAAYKAAELVRIFVAAGDEVRVVMTPAATRLVAPTDSELGAANKTELADYRTGFTLCRKISAVSNIDTSDPYSETGAGASVIRSEASFTFGKAMTSRIESLSLSNMAILSKPKASPPCGGVP